MRMRVMIHGQGITVDRALKEHAQRRLQFALSRFSTRIRDVFVRLTDVNGQRGGVDKRCRIVASLIPSGTVVIEDMDADSVVAIDRAADRMGRTIARGLRHRWELKRRSAWRTGDSHSRKRTRRLATSERSEA